MITLTLRYYWSRFGWEVSAFWLISLAATVLLMRNAPDAAVVTLAVLEIVALAWITVRLVLAEDGFGTSGGWRTRPFPIFVRHGLPLVAAAAVVLPTAIVRALAFQRMFAGTAIWTDLASGSWLWQVGAWLLFFALPLKLFGLLILQGIEGRAKAAAWATLALILLPVITIFGKSYGNRGSYYSNSGGNDPRALAQGIQRELPDARDFIGTWNDPVTSEQVSCARVVARFGIDPDVQPFGGSIHSREASLRGSRVNVRLRALWKKPGFAENLKNSIAVLRYPDGTYATCVQIAVLDQGPPLLFFPAAEWRFSGDFVSPLCLPEFEGDPARLTHGLELLFFKDDFSRPPLDSDLTRRLPDNQPKPAPRFTPATIAEAISQFPGSDEMWSKYTLPYLTNNVTRQDIPLLQERMRLDPRLFAVFINKLWVTDALPVLREMAKQRIPMTAGAVLALTEEKDPALSDDLLAISLQLKSGLEIVAPVLQGQPGFDWPTFAKEIWRRKKYSTNWLEPRGEFRLPAYWAAQEGDFTAFRATAELAAVGKKGETDQLAGLVAGQHADLIGYLRENIDQMKFDPATRKWTR